MSRPPQQQHSRQRNNSGGGHSNSRHRGGGGGKSRSAYQQQHDQNNSRRWLDNLLHFFVLINRLVLVIWSASFFLLDSLFIICSIPYYRDWLFLQFYLLSLRLDLLDWFHDFDWLLFNTVWFKCDWLVNVIG